MTEQEGLLSNKVTEITSNTARQTTLESTFNALIINAGSSNAEVVAARGSAVDLSTRLGGVDAQLSDNVIQLATKATNDSVALKADKTYVDTQLAEGALNVKSAGATGDGITDDTASILAVLNSANGKTVLFPPGEYLVSSNFLFDGLIGLTVFGYGATLKLKMTVDSPTGGVLYATPFHFTNCQNVRIFGLKVKADTSLHINPYINSQANTSKLFWANNCITIKIEDVSFTGHFANTDLGLRGTDAGIFISNSTDVVFNNVRYDDNTKEGIWLLSCKDVVINGLQATNPTIWSMLDIFLCDGVKIDNCNVLSNSGSETGSATANIYSSNVTINNSKFIGGSGFDFSDEANIFGTDEKNITMDNCTLTALYGFHVSGNKYADNVLIRKCNITAKFGFYVYMSDGRTVKNVTFEKCVFNVISALKYRALGGASLFKNIKFLECIVNCQTIAQSIAYQAWLSSFNGGSSGFCMVNEATLTSGNEVVENILIDDCRVYCEGSWVYSSNPYAGNKFQSKNLTVSNCRFYNHPSSPTLAVDRNLYIQNVQGLILYNNEMIDGKGSDIWSCVNPIIEGNKNKYINTTQTVPPFFIYLCSGRPIIRDNFSGSSLFNHIKGDLSVNANAFTQALIEDNYPDTYQTIHPSHKGATTDRPTGTEIITFRPWVDTTLGKLIFYNGASWKDSAGITV